MSDFASKQTNNTLPPHRYNSKVLIGNWYEERCDPENKSAFTANIEKFDNLKLYEKYNEANKQIAEEAEQQQQQEVIYPQLSKYGYFENGYKQ